MSFPSGQCLCICSFHWGKLIFPYLHEKINEKGSQNVSQVSTQDGKIMEIKKGKTEDPVPVTVAVLQITPFSKKF